MAIERGTIEGPLDISGGLQLDGMAKDDIRVVAGGHLVLHGTACGDVVVEPGGQAAIHGTVVGNVLNRGGVLDVLGVIRGRLDTIDGGDTRVALGAVIMGETPTE